MSRGDDLVLKGYDVITNGFLKSYSCSYGLLKDAASFITIRCPEEFGCCDNGCCMHERRTTSDAPMEWVNRKPISSSGPISIHSNNYATVWGIIIGLIAIAFFFLLLSVVIMACRRYRYANGTGTAKITTTTSAIGTVKIRPVELAPPLPEKKPDVANNV